MKKLCIACAVVCALISGCTSTITHYDENGKITRIEETTNFARVMDGTNSKSQMVLVDGTYIGFEASATAGENCTPGVTTKYVNGKIAFINEKDSGKFTGTSKVVEKFFAGKVSVGTGGVETK